MTSINWKRTTWKEKFTDNLKDQEAIEREINLTSISRSNFVNSNNDRIRENETSFQNHINSSSIDVVLRNINDESWTNKHNALVVFGGWGDRLYSVYTIFKNYNGYIIYFSDKYNQWYKPLISAFISVVKKYASSITNFIFFGWSMGGYAALHASISFSAALDPALQKKCVCIALTPQTANYLGSRYRSKLKLKGDSIYGISGNRDVPLIQPIEHMYKDIPTLLEENPTYSTKIFILIGKSECKDVINFKSPDGSVPPMYIDSLHLGLLLNFRNVSAVVFNRETHRLMESGINFPQLLNMCDTQFDRLFSDSGIDLLFSLNYREP
jgi:hypothetical protein